MLDRIIKYGKLKDFFNLKEFEVWFSLTLSFLIVFILYKIDVYNSIELYKDLIQNIILSIIGGLIGLLGFVLAGVTLVTTMFNKSLNQIIDRITQNKESIIKILTSYEFLALSIGVEIVFLLVIGFINSSNLQSLNVNYFYLSIYIICYSILFNLFYTVSTVGNSITLYRISLKYSDLVVINKTVIDECNEIRIDYILNKFGLEKGLSREQLLSDLISFTRKTNSQNKEEVEDYFNNYYS